MKNQSSMLRWAGFCFLALFAFVTFGHYAQSAADAQTAKQAERADQISIDALPADGKQELPSAVFPHDKHVKALGDKESCGTCHTQKLEGTEQLTFAFLETATLAGDARKNAFHTNCIGCHTKTVKEGKPSGPMEADCRSCHNPRPAASTWNDIGFDKQLHYQHIASQEIKAKDGSKDNCSVCHHTFNTATQKLEGTKDKADSCRACHLTKAEKAKVLAANDKAADQQGLIAERPTLDAAGHSQCVSCHLNVAKSSPSAKTGPVDCAGCHGSAAVEAAQKRLADTTTLNSVPRLERGQTDAVLMLPLGTPAANATMRPVSFNHKFHEGVTPDCRSCHHKGIASCSSCHSIEGKKEGNFVTYAAAMHKPDSSRSCIGCHNTQTAQPSCAGCHAAMPKRVNPTSCAQCHSTPVGVTNQQAENGSLAQLDKEERTRLAQRTVDTRETESKRAHINLSDIPEEVTIGILSDEYEPSKFPHRKIVASLMAIQDKSRLADAFHYDATTLCQGCHHNSPASLTPPKCVSCHAKDPARAKSDRPTLKAAYHMQCMNCHARMNQKPAETDCAGCHKPRVK